MINCHLFLTFSIVLRIWIRSIYGFTTTHLRRHSITRQLATERASLATALPRELPRANVSSYEFQQFKLRISRRKLLQWRRHDPSRSKETVSTKKSSLPLPRPQSCRRDVVLRCATPPRAAANPTAPWERRRTETSKDDPSAANTGKWKQSEDDGK